LRLEFSHYDYNKRGSISAKDFALSLVASADVNHISKLLDRVEELNRDQQLRDLRLTYREFQDFAELRKKLQSFSLAIFSYGKVNGVLTKTDFQRAASNVLISPYAKLNQNHFEFTNNFLRVICSIYAGLWCLYYG